MIPFLFSHLGILFAYHTTFFLSPAGGSLGARDRVWATSAPRVFAEQDPNAFEQQAQLSFQKNLELSEKFATATGDLSKILIKVYTFFNQKWHFDDFYNRFIVQKVISFGYGTVYRAFDAG